MRHSDLKRSVRSLGIPALAFLLPMLSLLAVCACRGLFPFGEKTFLTIDLHNQYISFFSYLRTMLRGEHSFFYTFSKTISGEMVGISAYYLMSPLNLLLCLFSTDRLPYAIELISFLKIGLSGLTMALFLRRRCDLSWPVLIFSGSYALTAYNIAYLQNIMWMDGVILLPLVAWGIDRILERRDRILYTLSLTAALLTDYYIGYMLCIFSVLFFLCGFFGEKREKRAGILLSFGVSSLLSGGMAAFLLVPVFRSLSDGKARFSLRALFSVNANFHWSDVFGKALLGAFDYEQVKTGLPNIFCGICVLFFAALFFLDRGISLRRKLCAAAFLAVMFASFYLEGANLFWHAWNRPTWFPYRYSFIFSFLLILLGCEGFRSLKRLSGRYLGICAAALCVFFCGVSLWMYRKGLPFLDRKRIVAGVAVFAVCALLAVLYRKRSVCLPLLLVLCLAELTVNAACLMGDFSYRDYSPYAEFVGTTEPLIEQVKSRDDSFYRMEKLYSRTNNDALLLDYHGLSHYSSAEKDFVKSFMGTMGFQNCGNLASYHNGSTLTADALMGVKYVLGRTPVSRYYTPRESNEDVTVYENPYAFPLGYQADESILDCRGSGNPFRLQNEILRAAASARELDPVFSEAFDEIDLELHNVERTEANGHVLYMVKDSGEKAFLRWTFTVREDGPVYAYFAAPENHLVEIRANGRKFGNYFDRPQCDVLRLGEHRAGDRIRVRMTLREGLLYLDDALFYREDMDALGQYYEAAKGGFLHLESFSDTRIAGDLDCGENGRLLVLTIPREDSWHIEVDGEEIRERAVVLDALMAVPLEPGSHRITLTYVCPGLRAGILISAACIVLFLLSIVPGIRRLWTR